MGDVFTDVTRTGFGKNIMNSIVGAFVGFFLFLGAFPLLWWNEGRTNMAEVAKLSKVAAADKADPSLDGKLVAVTSPLKSTEDLSDPDFLKPGPWITLARAPEMYAWIEKKHETEEKEIGGSTKTTTTWTYDMGWTSDPKPTTDFKHPEGHANPSMAVAGKKWCVKSATVGVYSFAAQDAELPSGDHLSVTQSMLGAPTDQGLVSQLSSAPKLDGNYLFIGKGSVSTPQLGDIRLSYSALARDMKVTLFGAEQGSTVVPFKYEEGKTWLRALTGTREEAIHELAVEHAVITWILRIVGFLMMWFGLSAVLGPLATVADVIPILGKMGRFMISLVMFPVSLVLTTVTVIVSMILHSLVATIIVGVVMLVGVIVVLKLMKGHPAAGAGVSA